MSIQSKIRYLVRYYFRMLNFCHIVAIRPFFKRLDLSSQISPKATFYGAGGISIGPKVQVLPNAVVSCTRWSHVDEVAGTISIGEFTAIEPFAYIWSCGGNIKIGRRCSVNSFCILYGHGDLEIGDNVRIATHTVIIPSNHKFDRLDVPIYQQGAIDKGIKIEDDVWIGAGVTILDGVVIRKGCVIGAGSVITRSTEPYGVYVGVPAKRIKSRTEGKAGLGDNEKIAKLPC